jgi:hypothetical protein
MGTTSKNKATALASMQALMAGMQKRFPSGQFTLGNESFTTASLVTLIKGVCDAMTALNDAQAKAKDAKLAFTGENTKAAPVIRDLRRFLRATFGNATEALADFGLKPTKAPAPKTAEQRVVATAKLRATRKARGTASHKQKLAVKGNVVGVDVTPVTVSVAPSPATQPASTASSAPAPQGTGAATK